MKKEKIGAIVILTILISFMCGALGAYFIFGNITVTNNGTIVTNGTASFNEDNSISKGVSNIYDAVVVVEGFKGNQLISTGTGFIYKKTNNKAYIMTNHHVISDASSVKIILSNKEVLDVEIMGSEVYSDIAVLSTNATKINNVAIMGNTENLKVGDTLFTVGSPEGSDYAGTVTKGILSGKDRLVSVALSGNNQYDYYMKVIQTDAAINPGNSGGPICNINGEVVGVTNMKLVDSTVEGMGFAIPIEDALIYAETLEQGKQIIRPYFGIGMCDVNDQERLYYNQITVDKSITEGVVVLEVSDKSTAKKAGLKKGDVIIELGGEKVNSVASLRYELYKHTVGEEVVIKYIRDGKEKTVTVKLAEKA